jgi:hypothetical protein
LHPVLGQKTGILTSLILFLVLFAQRSTAQTFNAVLYAGNKVSGYSGDGGQATSASFTAITYLWMDTVKKLYLADLSNERIRMVSASKIVTTFAGEFSSLFKKLCSCYLLFIY